MVGDCSHTIISSSSIDSDLANVETSGASGKLIGRTTDDGMKVQDRPVSEGDFLGTVCLALGLDPEKQNLSNVGRPIRLIDPKASPLKEIVV